MERVNNSPSLQHHPKSALPDCRAKAEFFLCHQADGFCPVFF
jgi:hypothetical protein